MYLSINPDFPIATKGPDAGSAPSFEPDVKVGWDFSKEVQAGIEYYAETGPVKHFDPLSNQHHIIFPAVDLNVSPDWELNFGVGRGLTDTSEQRLGQRRFNLPTAFRSCPVSSGSISATAEFLPPGLPRFGSRTPEYGSVERPSPNDEPPNILAKKCRIAASKGRMDLATFLTVLQESGCAHPILARTERGIADKPAHYPEITFGPAPGAAQRFAMRVRALKMAEATAKRNLTTGRIFVIEPPTGE
jgi:hypothetical protein